MRYIIRKWVKAEDLNAHRTLFGGRLLAWIDEEAALYAILQLDTKNVVTKYMSEIEFISSPVESDIIEIEIRVVKLGRTSITLACEVFNMITQKTIITIDKIVMVNVEDSKPTPHGKTEVKPTDNIAFNK